MEPGERIIQLAPMPQLAEAKDREDDWTGLSDAKARRKRQSRLSKRAQRRRKASERYAACYPELLQCRPESLSFGDSAAISAPVKSIAYAHDEEVTSTRSAVGIVYSHNSFPLPQDHLFTLIHFNVYRAILTNMLLLSSLSITYFSDCDFDDRIILPPVPENLPASLVPTFLQQRTTHPSWMDLIPLATMRDNFIRSRDVLDEDALCMDMCGGLFRSYSKSDRNGMIVWSDPWHISAWEVTEGFVLKWGFLLSGCQELWESTNRWRAVRNEEPLPTWV